ncbi:TniB family NTP-binding protein [Streptomyces tropicalis]|uniref:AAA family ATPase n=1 Tax=Streptomyces tropicalis TaxID=3034234 RepID=A0ABT6A8E5_9ACTN|nr:TniB family NTP-binding protein [Streptomyces tropicalis]MDF3300908.1 AAA family ATPase [Streptomyces tropicalis]
MIRDQARALSRKEGWNAYVQSPEHVQPEQLTRTQFCRLGEEAAADYLKRARKWHANIGPIKTPQLADLQEVLWDIVDSNEQDGDQARSAVAVNAFPGLGKSTSVIAFARLLHRREIAESGPLTADGHERLPVCRVGLTGNTGIKDLNRSMLEFFAHPGSLRGTTTELGQRALDCILRCEVRVLIIDDLHFLKWGSSSGIEVSNHLKWISNEFPVTLIMIGVGLDEKGLFSEGLAPGEEALAQTGRRTTLLGMRPFTIDSEAGRREWRQILLTLEKRIVLPDKYPGMLADDLSDYMFVRSTGHIGSLMALVRRGCQRAMRTQEFKLTQDLLDKVRNDEASERARLELQVAMEAGKLTSKPRQVRRGRA